MNAGNSQNPYIYTPSTNTWQVLSVWGFWFVADERDSPAMASVGTNTYLHGGYSAQTTSYGYDVNILFGET